jgi:hypothetical protein
MNLLLFWTVCVISDDAGNIVDSRDERIELSDDCGQSGRFQIHPAVANPVAQTPQVVCLF